MAYAYLLKLWHTFTSFCSYPDKFIVSSQIMFQKSYESHTEQSLIELLLSCIPIFKNNNVLLNCTGIKELLSFSL